MEFYKSTYKLWDGFWYTFCRWKIDGKIKGFNVHGESEEIAEARAKARLPEWLWEKLNG